MIRQSIDGPKRSNKVKKRKEKKATSEGFRLGLLSSNRTTERSLGPRFGTRAMVMSKVTQYLPIKHIVTRNIDHYSMLPCRRLHGSKKAAIRWLTTLYLSYEKQILIQFFCGAIEYRERVNRFRMVCGRFPTFEIGERNQFGRGMFVGLTLLYVALSHLG